ncbi:hypothetical protein BDN72DRAFT_848487 [Pluteus cervinus]|uniref:Uncharacterized protein n=1 Tax=Pluteus cervinus TaxID=181527 RepID=A0ACD3AAA4_9AGAR|nr:hypothetical protein BDN72DRAFT_848487 [Pluteus cervinus]
MAKGQTPWTQPRQPTSSLPSDRLRPQSNSPKPTGKSGSQQKQTQAQQPPRSKEVERLDGIVNALKKLSGKENDPKGGCFCQAREHTLSTYRPICLSCGLILCNLNLPQFACPHCTVPLFTPSTRSELLTQLEQERDTLLTREALERDRAVMVAKQAQGAFPSLPGSRSGSGSPSPAPGQSRAPTRTPTPSTSTPHKVLSLTGNKNGGKRVIVSSYTTKPVSQTFVTEDTKEKEVELTRVPPPPSEVVHMKGTRDRLRPWKNFDQPDLMYAPAPQQDRKEGEGRKKKGGGGVSSGS